MPRGLSSAAQFVGIQKQRQDTGDCLRAKPGWNGRASVPAAGRSGGSPVRTAGAWVCWGRAEEPGRAGASLDASVPSTRGWRCRAEGHAHSFLRL